MQLQSVPTSTISISTGAASLSPQSIPPASCGGRQTEVGVSEHSWRTVSLQEHQVCHLRARLQADTPVYSILDCDARIKVLGTSVFAKVAPVNLMGVFKKAIGKHKVSGEGNQLWNDVWIYLIDLFWHLMKISRWQRAARWVLGCITSLF